MRMTLYTLLTAATLVLSLPIININTMKANNDEKGTIKIQTSDEKVIEVSKESIQHMITIKHMLEDLPYSTVTIVPLPNIDKKTLDLMLDFINIIKNITDKDEQKVAKEEYFNEKIKDNETLVSLITAANYLDFGILLDDSTDEFSLRISKIDSENDVTKITEEIKSLPDEIKHKVFDNILFNARHYLEVCSLKSTTKFGTKKLEKDIAAAIYSVGFSPDGKYIVYGTMDNKVIRWNTKTDNSTKILEGHTDMVNSVGFSPDGKYIASGSTDKTVIIWDAETGNLIKTLEGHTDMVNSVSWSPDSKYIASGSEDKIVIIWDAETDKQIKTLKGHTHSVVAVTWSSDSKYIASGSRDETVIIWDAETGSQIKTLKRHTHTVLSVKFSPASKYIASGSADNTVIRWNTKTDNSIKILEGHTDMVNSVGFSPDGKYIASGSDDSKVIIWDAETGNKIKIIKKGLYWQVKSVSWSPDGRYIALSFADPVVIRLELFDDKTWEPLNKVDQLTFEQALELTAAINAQKKGNKFELKHLIDSILIQLLKQCY